MARAGAPRYAFPVFRVLDLPSRAGPRETQGHRALKSPLLLEPLDHEQDLDDPLPPDMLASRTRLQNEAKQRAGLGQEPDWDEVGLAIGLPRWPADCELPPAPEAQGPDVDRPGATGRAAACG